MKFAVLDVETANARRHSICQIGIVVFEHGQEIAAGASLIDPREQFDPFNVKIHGLTADHVKGAPTFADVHEQIARMLHGQIVVAHSSFDRFALAQACDLHGAQHFDCKWLDSLSVARAAWPEMPNGHGLKALTSHFGLTFQHHDALEDARATGQILLRAMADTGKSLEHLISETGGSSGSKGQTYRRSDLRREGDGDGPLLGEIVVFTGKFSIPKEKLADLASIAGAAVEIGVTKRTTMVVVGTQDWTVVGPTGKSSKHRRAEELIESGAPISIVAEEDFRQLVRGPGGVA